MAIVRLPAIAIPPTIFVRASLPESSMPIRCDYGTGQEPDDVGPITQRCLSPNAVTAILGNQTASAFGVGIHDDLDPHEPTTRSVLFLRLVL